MKFKEPIYSYLDGKVCLSCNDQQILETNLELNGYKNPLLLIDNGVVNNGEFQSRYGLCLETCFHKNNIIIYDLGSEPTYSYLNKLVDQSRARSFDCTVGIGGGSVLDCAKAIAALKNNEGDAIDFRGFDKIKNKNVPTVLLPSTGGTGSEATNNASFVDEKTKVKMGINGNFMWANHTIVDGTLIASCPFRPALSSTLDALVHILESFTNTSSTPVSRHYSCLAFKYIYYCLKDYRKKHKSSLHGLNCGKGAYLAGAALVNSGSGISGALSYPLGVNLKIPHGYAGALTVLHIMEFNIKNGYEGYSELAREVDLATESKLESSMILHNQLTQIFSHLSVPSKVTDFNDKKYSSDELYEMCQAVKSSTKNNPSSFNFNDDLLKVINLIK